MSEGTVLLQFTVPTEWPPVAATRVYSGVHEGSAISVDATPDSRFVFMCIHGSIRHEFVTPELKMPGFSNLKVAFTWGPDDSMVAINGVVFSEEVFRLGEAVAIKSRVGKETGLREPLVVAVPHGLELIEERLVRSIIELQERIAKVDRVNLLAASAILRQLLLDAHPLIILVNRKHRLKLRYPAVTTGAVATPDVLASYGYLNLSVLVSTRGSAAEFSLDEFLSLVAVIGEKSYSVRDVIAFCANTKGGVHFDDPTSNTSKELLAIDDAHFPELVDASLHAIADLSWCVIQAAKPLVMKIVEDHAAA